MVEKLAESLLFLVFEVEEEIRKLLSLSIFITHKTPKCN